MISYNDPAASRRVNFFKCIWWKRDTISDDDDSQLVMSRQPIGTFYAREYAPETLSNSTIAGSFMLENVTVTITTQDNVSRMVPNDLVKYKEELWIVETIQPKYIRQNSSQFANDGLGAKCFYIRMRKY